jgi:glycosyltransferase involved in cell wall biosynthesis
VKVAIVVQRYGAEINGGAELHARYIAEHLARHVRVEVLTTCARDYITWADDYPAGETVVHGIPVRRFRVAHPRDPKAFGDWSARVFGARHSVNDELAWLDAEGPTSPDLVKYIAAREADYDFVLFFSFRYYHSFHGARAVPGKAIFVPTAERDEALGLGIFPPVLRAIRGFMYNSPEERALLQAAAGTDEVPGVVVGVGSEVPQHTHPQRFRQKTGIHDRTAIYIGRIDENKGCVELFDYWRRYAEITPGGMTLVLIGQPVLPIPQHPRIRHLGFVSDQEKFDALAAAEFLIMPSYFESLSMVALEAWALGKPVLANGKCDVLRGQAVRSNAGLYYENYAEFVEAVRVLEGSPGVASSLGRNGSNFFRTHYAWPVIERKYLDMFERLRTEDPAAVARRAMTPVPGWWGRRQKTLPAAREVLAALPSGPVTRLHDSQPARAVPPPASREGRPDEGRSHGRHARPDPGGRPSRDPRDSRGREGRPARDGRAEVDGRERRDGRGGQARSGRDDQQRRDRDRQAAERGGDSRGDRRSDPRAERGGRPAAASAPADGRPRDDAAAGDAAARHRGHRGGRHRRGRRPGSGPARKDDA